jgi:hypothetical protein
MTIRDHIRKRRHEEDDDMMVFILHALYMLGSRGARERKGETSYTSANLRGKSSVKGT